MAYKKGQNLRLFVGDGSSTKCIAASTTCTFHVAGQTEDTSTKDSTGDWAENEVTGLSWDCSAEALVLEGTDSGAQAADALLSLMINKTKVKIEFAPTSGDKNRTKGTVIKTGYAYITDYSENAGNRQNASFSVQFTGTGALS